MWSFLHDIFIAFALGLHLIYRTVRGVVRRDHSVRDYAASRAGLRIGELGADISRGPTPLLWFHGVSVGEVTALDAVIAAIRTQTSGSILIAVSTMTIDGLRAARRLANQPDVAFIYPLDLSFFAKRIVKRLRPKALVIIDGDFWFQMMRACQRASVPVIVINGRLSESSVKGHERFPSYAHQLFSGIALASAQSETMAERFARFIPKSRIVVDGNIKMDLQPATLSGERREALCGKLGIDPSNACFVFGSIHPAELEEIATPIARLLAERKGVQVVIAPRHPTKFSPAVLAKYFSGVRSTWVEDDEPVAESSRLIWVNRLGILRDLYQIASAAFVGGTFCDVGGHNLAEPALFGVPVIYGPDVHAQLPLHELLDACGASKQVATSDQLYQTMAAMVDNASFRENLAKNAVRMLKESEGLNARIAARILKTAKIVV
jgi:3-deoxy-D-manno-octulosonic-acid transferase